MNRLIVYRRVSHGSFEDQQMHIKEKALDKVSRLAYKDLIFNVKEDIQEGRFERGTFNGDIYTVKLKQDSVHEFVYGKIEAVFRINEDNKTFEFLEIEPADFIMDVHRKILPIYKGVMYRDDRDKFKIDYALTKKNNDYKARKEKDDSEICDL